MPTSANSQRKFLRKWAQNLGVELGSNVSRKDQFKLLAFNELKWIPDDPQWRVCWGTCFGEQYEADKTAHNDDVANELAVVTAALSLDSSKPTKKKRNKGNPAVKPDDDEDSTENGGIPLSKKDIDAFFDNRYGTDFSKLEKWQMLCVDVGVNPVPPSITKCKKELKALLINIHDVVNPRRPVTRWDSWAEFVDYTKKGRVYPLCKAKKDSFIKIFLKDIGFARSHGRRG